MSIKKNDKVLIISGKDKGKQSTVLSVKGSKITVHHINMKVHHQKARKAGDKSGIIHLEGFIDRSNVMPVCPGCNKPCRINSSHEQSKTIRACNRCSAPLQ